MRSASLSTAPVAAPAVAVPRGVGLYLAAVQLLFALGWITYAIYLPELAQQAGLERRWVPWILALDQLIFLVTDLVVGVWSDKAAAVQGRIAKAVLAATLVSSLAFLLLPWLAPQGPGWLFMLVTLCWAVTSSALRAPPLTLLGRYVAKPLQPAMVAFTALGLGLANAASPYVGLVLKGVDARLPFLLSALSLAAVTLGMVAAEKALARQRALAGSAAAMDAPALPGLPPAGGLFLVAVLVAAASFQVHVFLASAPLYRAAGGAEQMANLMPVFWIGFNLALWPASRWVRRTGAPLALAQGAVLGAMGVAAAHAAPALPWLVAAQLVAGAAWAVMLCSAFVGALGFGHTGREGFYNGSLQSLLAVAALSRLMVVVWIAPTAAQLVGWAGLPALTFALVGLLVVAGLTRVRGWPAT
ncbi:MAG: MFS transporter [Burkholderiales bacterium]|nr:MFS transporter [Burkholderiales bacterium]